MNMNAPIKRILCSVLLLAFMPAVADELLPQTYIAIEAEVREITIAGVHERVDLLSGGDSTPGMEAIIDAANRRHVSQAYLDNGTTAAAHAAYGTRHAAEIAAWLDANPEWQAHFDSLTSEFETLSNQLDGLGEGN